MNLTDFKYQSKKDWRKEAERLLKGKPFRDALYSKSDEGIILNPIYFEEDRPDFSISGQNKESLIAQTLFCGNENFNVLARDVLSKGQNALNFNLDVESQLGRDIAHTNKLALHIADYPVFSSLLKGLDLTHIALFFNAFNTADKILDWLKKFCRENKTEISGLNIATGADPVSAALIYGGFVTPFKDALNRLILIVKSKLHIPGLDGITINSDIIHNSGGHKIHELAYILSCIITYTNHLTEQGFTADQVLSSIRIKMAVGNDQFMEIAKLRAVRLLWANICDAFKSKPGPAKIDVVTSWRFLSNTDTYTNMLRSTGQAFSAIVGGCDSLDILPFDLAVKQPDTFSLRQARNVFIILTQESHLSRVFDPSAGSNYLDNFTQELARKSWQFFRETEQQGGIIESIKSGRFQSYIKKNAIKQEQELVKGDRKAIGFNCYKNDEKKKEQMDLEGSYYNHIKLFNEIEPLEINQLLFS